MERRKSLKRKKEEDMSEQEARLPSVRARVAEFESHSRDQEQDDSASKNCKTTGKRKRFTYPGRQGCSQDPEQQQSLLSFPLPQRIKPSGTTTDFEAHLQEVWSVRKNIHHKQQQNPVTTNSGSKTSILQSTAAGGIVLTQADKYSRHGAVPADQPQRPRDKTRDHNTAIETITPWSVRKKGNFRFSETTTTKQQATPTPAVTMTSSPTKGKKKGRGGEPARICKEDFEPAVVTRRDYSDKVNYAQKMAKGYLRSVGSGEYTPQQDGYCKDSSTPADTEKPTQWKRNDSDEFDF